MFIWADSELRDEHSQSPMRSTYRKGSKIFHSSSAMTKVVRNQRNNYEFEVLCMGKSLCKSGLLFSHMFLL